MFATRSKLPPSSVHVSNSGPTGTGCGCSVAGLAGKIDVHISTISPAQQNYSETTGHTGSRDNSDSPLVAENSRGFQTYFDSLWTTLCSFHTAQIFCLNRIRDTSRTESRTICMHGGSHATLQRQQAFQTRCLGLPQHLGDPQLIACATIGGFASLAGPHGRDLIPTGYRTCLGSVLNRTGKAKVALDKTICDMIASMELQRPFA